MLTLPYMVVEKTKKRVANIEYPATNQLLDKYYDYIILNTYRIKYEINLLI